MIMRYVAISLIVSLLLLSPFAVAQKTTQDLVFSTFRVIMNDVVFLTREAFTGVQIFWFTQIQRNPRISQELNKDLQKTKAIHRITNDEIKGKCLPSSCYISPQKTCKSIAADCSESRKEIESHFSD